MPDGGTEQSPGPGRGEVSQRGAADPPRADPHLVAFVAAARASLRAKGVGGGRKGRAVSVRVDADLLAAAAARPGVASQSEVLDAGLAVLAGADTFGIWLMNQAGALDPDLDVDV